MYGSASWVCFFCGNPVNSRRNQSHVVARIWHGYKDRAGRDSARRFHCTCFDKFQAQGRPLNPHTHYEVLEFEEVNLAGTNA
jgi:hypothetical protein